MVIRKKDSCIGIQSGIPSNEERGERFLEMQIRLFSPPVVPPFCGGILGPLSSYSSSLIFVQKAQRTKIN